MSIRPRVIVLTGTLIIIKASGIGGAITVIINYAIVTIDILFKIVV